MEAAARLFRSTRGQPNVLRPMHLQLMLSRLGEMMEHEEQAPLAEKQRAEVQRAVKLLLGCYGDKALDQAEAVLRNSVIPHFALAVRDAVAEALRHKAED